MLLHINSTSEIARSFRDQTPVTALCGYRRVVDEALHDARMNDPQNHVCEGCQSILDYEVREGRARPLEGRPTVAEVKTLAAQPQQNSWTFIYATNGTPDKRFPLAS